MARLLTLFFLFASWSAILNAETLPDWVLEGEQVVETRRLSYLDAFILGVVEGVTEYLPISSTGHLILTNEWLGLNQDTPVLDRNGQPVIGRDGAPYTLKQAADAYAIVIQGGAIAAVILIYWQRLLGMLMGFLGRDARGLRLARNLIVAFMPAAIIGLLINSWIEENLFSPATVAFALFAGGVLMLGVEQWRKRRVGHLTPEQQDAQSMDIDQLTIRQSLTIGLLQCVAMWPGTSRSMMTIVGGYLVGLSPRRAAEFSFLLGLITLSAAAAYKTLKDGSEMVQALDFGPVLFGCIVALVAAFLSVRWLVGYLSRHGLALFAWYRFALAGIVLWFLVL